VSVKKFWNLSVKKGADGSKHLDVHLHGVIDGNWTDDEISSSSDLAAKLAEHPDAKTIGVRINSVGGSMLGGVTMYNALASHPGEVTCYVQGLCASAATLPAMAGKTVMGPGSMMMVHKPASGVYGDADAQRKLADVLDKAQESSVAIYEKKTGKSRAELNDLINSETWMTAEDAVAKGFADCVGNAPTNEADSDGDTDSSMPNDPQDLGETVLWNGAEFPRAAMPAQILAMAKKPVPPLPIAAVVPATPVLALVPPLPPPAPITRAELAQRDPALLASLIEEGRTAGIAAERARLSAIDELPAMGCADLVQAAKYGAKPTDAPTLAVEIVKAQKGAGAELLAARRIESKKLADVTPGAVENSDQAATARIVKAITDGGNARRGGSGK
jgi:ATP-dependent protease ClpP protease subunit